MTTEFSPHFPSTSQRAMGVINPVTLSTSIRTGTSLEQLNQTNQGQVLHMTQNDPVIKTEREDFSPEQFRLTGSHSDQTGSHLSDQNQLLIRHNQIRHSFDDDANDVAVNNSGILSSNSGDDQSEIVGGNGSDTDVSIVVV